MALEWFCAKPHLSLCLSWDSFVALVDTALFYLRMNIRKWCRTILFLQTICDVFLERCPTARKNCTKIICENLELNKIDEKKFARVLFTCISGGWGAPARSLSSVMYFSCHKKLRRFRSILVCDRSPPKENGQICFANSSPQWAKYQSGNQHKVTIFYEVTPNKKNEKMKMIKIITHM